MRWPIAWRGRVRWSWLRRGAYRLIRHSWVRRSLIGIGAVLVVTVISAALFWWRLSSGPIEFNLATPWLKSAIEENLGAKYTVSIGGTQLERDEQGHPSVRILDIVVRDGDGATVASSPKAEIGISGFSILTGHIRAASLNLVGAELSVRIEQDGQFTVFAGANSKPLARAPLPVKPPSADAATGRPSIGDASTALAWLEKFTQTELGAYDLRQIGLKNGNLTVDDQRNGKRWSFNGINLGVARPNSGGFIFRLASDTPDRPWDISAALRPLSDGIRAVGIEVRRVSVRDILLALRIDGIEADIPLSASLRAEFSADGNLLAARGQIIADSGVISEPGRDDTAIKFGRADVRVFWDARDQNLVLPFQLQADGAQITMLAKVEPNGAGRWKLTVARGDSVIDPIILSPSQASGSEGFSFNRVAVTTLIDLDAKRIRVEQGDFGRQDVRASHNVGIAVTGTLDYAGPEARLNFGVAGTRMPVSLLKRLWPKPVAAKVRTWVEGHITAGTVERTLIAGNALVPVLLEPGVPLPDEGLSIEIDTTGTTLRPAASLPEIRDADLSVRVTGRTAVVSIGRGTAEVGEGRRLNIAGVKFEVPDTHLKGAPARATFRIDGGVPAAIALLANDRLRGTTGLALDPATSRGTMSALVTLDLALTRDVEQTAARYSMAIDLSNFVAERLLLGQKVEAAALRVNANSQSYAVKGDVRINGTAATLDYRKSNVDADAEVRLVANLDEAARRRLGIDLGSAVSGTIPVKVSGKVRSEDAVTRLAVEADFTPARIDNLLPGWIKASGRAARATFNLIKDGKITRFEDMTIEGQGALAKGSVELDGNGDLANVNFPVFGLSDGDKTSLRAERAADGTLRVIMRGDVYDGRAFVKSAMANTQTERGKPKSTDIDLDIKLGTVAGHNGETLRGLDLKLNRRNGRIRSLVLGAKIGRDTPLSGDLRLRSQDNHQVVYIETDDAGALFRFTDTYPRLFGGQMWLAFDPPTPDNAAQVGVLSMRNFSIRGEAGLERVVSGVPAGARGSVEFSELQAEFTRLSGKMQIRNGVVRGPQVGATIDGQIDFTTNDLRLRGTFVPLYAINNVFGQIPILGLFLGGGNKEGLLGITYEATGSPSSPRITVNPISAVAPGLLRKLLPSPGMFDPVYVQPTR